MNKIVNLCVLFSDGLYEEIPLNDEYDLEYYQDLFHEV